DVAEDQLALSARVTGVDQGIDIFALGQLDQQLQAFGRALVRRPQLEFRRDDGKVGEAPFSLDRIVGRDKTEQMPDTGSEHVTFAFKIVALAREASEGA